MKLFGIVQAFDQAKGFGSIKPEAGGDALRFENSAIKWNRTDNPRAKQRLTFEMGAGKDGEPCAVNLQSPTDARGWAEAFAPPPVRPRATKRK